MDGVMMRHTIAALLLTPLLLLPPSSQAETTSDFFQVQLTVVPTCSVDSAEQLDRARLITAGKTTPPAPNTDSKLDVACSRGTSYDVGLTGTNAIRTIRSAKGSTSRYELVLDDNNNPVWHNTSVLGATGTGKTVSHQVISRLPDNFTLTTDKPTRAGVALSDELTITLTF